MIPFDDKGQLMGFCQTWNDLIGKPSKRFYEADERVDINEI